MSGRLPRKRVDDAALRVVQAKMRVGLFRKKLVDLEAISDAIDTPDDDKRAQDIADRAVTLVKNEGSVLPLKNGRQSCLINLTSSRATRLGQILTREFTRRYPTARAVTVDATMPLAAIEADAGDLSKCSAVVVAGFAPVSTGRGTAALGGDLNSFVEKLAAGKTPVAMVALGNPYLLAAFPKVAAYMATFSTSLPSEIAAAKALAGEIPITGELPVSIPGLARFGDGIRLNTQARAVH